MTATPAHSFLILLLLASPACLLQSPALAQQDLLQQSNAALTDLQRFEEVLAEMEFEFGPFDPRLIEPLQSIEAIEAELGNFERVRELQMRRLQLLRTAEGLENINVIPVLEEIIATEKQLGSWEEITDHLDHIRTVIASNYGSDSPELLAAMDRQASWMQSMVFLDRNGARAGNFLDSRDLYEDMLDLAENIYGEDSPLLIPWLYKRAYSIQQHVEFLNAGSSVTTDTVDRTLARDGPGRLMTASRGGVIAPFSASGRLPVTQDGEPVGVAYLRQANGYIDEIRDIAEGQGDWETWALATIYHGDFSVLQGRNIGRRDYLDARDKLLGLGFDGERLERFFSKPMPIPLENFYTRFADLEAYQLSMTGQLNLDFIDEEDLDDPWDEPVHVGVFTAWEEGLRSTAKPTPLDSLLAVALSYDLVDLAFRVSGNGEVSGVDVLEAVGVPRRIRSRTVRAARELHFRPALYGERTRTRRHVQLRYRILMEED